MLEEAKYYLNMTQDTPSLTIRMRIAAILQSIMIALDSIVLALGIGEFFKPSESKMQADFKFQKIMMLLSLFNMLSCFFIPTLGSSTGSLIIGGVLLSIAALSIIWPFIKPKTTFLPANAKNWTQEVKQKSFSYQARQETLDEIANNLKMGVHSMLLGPPRLGKSYTAKALAQAIENGDYPELNGKVIFRLNTTELVNQPSNSWDDENNILKKISDAMGKDRQDIILVFDEIHMACKNKEKIADQFKTYLEEDGEFPHVIGITTEKEYAEYIKSNQAFALRFSNIIIDNTSKDETLKILSDYLLKSPSHPLIKETALEYIYEKSCQAQEACQPLSAIKLLKKCINCIGKTQNSPTKRKIVEISQCILSLQAQNAVHRGRKQHAQIEISQLQQQKEQLQQVLQIEQQEIESLFKSKELLDHLTKEMYVTVIKIHTLSSKLLKQTQTQLYCSLFLNQLLISKLESHIKKTSKILGIKFVIDEELVNEVLSQ